MSHGGARKTSVYQLISDVGDPVSICKQLQEGRFNFSKKKDRGICGLFRPNKSKKNNFRGAFFLTALPNIALQILSQLYIFQSSTKHRKKGFNSMTEHKSLTITAHLLTEGIQKNRVHTDALSKIVLSKIITGSKIFEHKHQKSNIRIISGLKTFQA